jgi:hypothetical protein
VTKPSSSNEFTPSDFIDRDSHPVDRGTLPATVDHRRALQRRANRGAPSATRRSKAAAEMFAACGRPSTSRMSVASSASRSFPTVVKAPGCPPGAHPPPDPPGACQRTLTHPSWGWPSSPHLRGVLLRPARSHGKMTDGRFNVYCSGPIEFPPRLGTLPTAHAISSDRIRSSVVWRCAEASRAPNVASNLESHISHPPRVASC